MESFVKDINCIWKPKYRRQIKTCSVRVMSNHKEKLGEEKKRGGEEEEIPICRLWIRKSKTISHLIYKWSYMFKYFIVSEWTNILLHFIHRCGCVCVCGYAQNILLYPEQYNIYWNKLWQVINITIFVNIYNLNQSLYF